MAAEDVSLSQLPVVFLLVVILFGAVSTIYVGSQLEPELTPTPLLARSRRRRLLLVLPTVGRSGEHRGIRRLLRACPQLHRQLRYGWMDPFLPTHAPTLNSVFKA